MEYIWIFSEQVLKCFDAKSSSSATENRALDSILAMLSGCKLRIADIASLEIVGSYNKAYHLCAISLSVNLQLNLTPLWTIGFQRPKSLFKFFCFLDLFRFDDDETVEVDGALLKVFNAMVYKPKLVDVMFNDWVRVRCVFGKGDPKPAPKLDSTSSSSNFLRFIERELKKNIH
ncbi:hypothetical protein AGLY_013433 [Aphis glycines]|uniref:Uncharacterized protein n=1 Tax=Aphis glycines TaxID=307491 RepID=A0A6G0T8F9_APHGL|nr:hypothetical protein AGLY_013433 [Aphis glycines]